MRSESALPTCSLPLCLYPACFRHLAVLNPSCGLMASLYNWQQPVSIIGASFLFLTRDSALLFRPIIGWAHTDFQCIYILILAKGSKSKPSALCNGQRNCPSHYEDTHQVLWSSIFCFNSLAISAMFLLIRSVTPHFTAGPDASFTTMRSLTKSIRTSVGKSLKLHMAKPFALAFRWLPVFALMYTSGSRSDISTSGSSLNPMSAFLYATPSPFARMETNSYY